MSFAFGAVEVEVEHFVVRDVLLEFEQEVVVFGVVPGGFDVVARERADGVERFPERDQQKMGPIALGSPKYLDAEVSGRRPIVGDAGSSRKA